MTRSDLDKYISEFEGSTPELEAELTKILDAGEVSWETVDESMRLHWYRTHPEDDYEPTFAVRYSVEQDRKASVPSAFAC